MLPSEGIFYLDKSKEQLKKAPGFDKNKMPDIGNVRWGAEIHRYYSDEYDYHNDYGYGYYARQDLSESNRRRKNKAGILTLADKNDKSGKDSK